MLLSFSIVKITYTYRFIYYLYIFFLHLYTSAWNNFPPVFSDSLSISFCVIWSPVNSAYFYCFINCENISIPVSFCREFFFLIDGHSKNRCQNRVRCEINHLGEMPERKWSAEAEKSSDSNAGQTLNDVGRGEWKRREQMVGSVLLCSMFLTKICQVCEGVHQRTVA